MTVLAACNLCEAICGLELTIEDGRVTSVRGNPDDPLSRGHICPKGVAIADVYDDPDRLRRPVKRVADEWVEISWDEALDLTADGIAGTINRHGPNAVGVYLGNPNVHSLGAQTHGPRRFAASPRALIALDSCPQRATPAVERPRIQVPR